MLELHPEAEGELDSSLAWYLERSIPAASAFLASVRKALADIETTPDRWPADADGFRAARLRKYPFQIIYREIDGGLRVVAVAHTARRPDYWKSRE
jgi:toxin ParE1/3/4